MVESVQVKDEPFPLKPASITSPNTKQTGQYGSETKKKIALFTTCLSEFMQIWMQQVAPGFSGENHVPEIFSNLSLQAQEIWLARLRSQ